MDGVSVVFHSQGWPAVSPAASFPVSGVDDLRRLLAGILPAVFEHTNFPGPACGYFVGAVVAGLGPWSVEVHNIPGLRVGERNATSHARYAFRRAY